MKHGSINRSKSGARSRSGLKFFSRKQKRKQKGTKFYITEIWSSQQKGHNTLLNRNDFYIIGALNFVRVSIKPKLQIPGATERHIADISECSTCLFVCLFNAVEIPKDSKITGLPRIKARKISIEEDNMSKEIPNY